MKRDIEADLLSWKEHEQRMPLLMRGARQVGKSYIIEQFGRKQFKNCVVINFEQFPEFKYCFKSLDPQKILDAIELMTKEEIEPHKTLLFLDEIQECPEAIMALRYFKEQKPEFPIIGAGSLLEFTLNDPHFRMPVGRVQSIYLRPLSFGEYLEATGNSKARKFISTLQLGDEIEDAVHQHFLNLVREYFTLGGMPAVLAEYLQSHKLRACQEIQSSLLLAFRNDFGKYAGRTPHDYLQSIFSKTPGLIGKWLKYSTLNPDVAVSTLKNALHKLTDAGVIVPVFATSGSGLPFIAHRNEKKCKLLFLDIGLVQRSYNLEIELLMNEDIQLVSNGALAEQYVGQELLAYMGKNVPNELYAWSREVKSSSAEVDFLVAVAGAIIPIEVKAGAIGKMRSLRMFLNDKKAPLGVRISSTSLSLEDSVLSIPFYMIQELPRLVKSALERVAK